MDVPYKLPPQTPPKALLPSRPPETDVKPKNVVLIGSTGHGKSTFGNFLLNCGEGDVFTTSDLMEPCTKEVRTSQVAPYSKFPPLNVIDTPGLNDENDLPQMINVAKRLQELGEISAVILCLSHSTRADVNFISTVKYYQRLLNPVFAARNVILICTKMSNDTYMDLVANGRIEDIIEDRRKVTSDALGIDVDICEVVNSVIPSKKRQKIMDAWDAMKTKTNLARAVMNTVIGDPSQPTKSNIWISSLLTRERLLRVIYAFPDVDIRYHKFPIPPVLEDKRKTKLATLMELSNELVKAVEVENKSRGAILEHVKTLENSMQLKADRLALYHQQLDSLKGVQKTESIYKHGDELFYFKRIKYQTLAVPVTNFIIRDNSYNCKWEKKAYEKGLVTLDIIPNLICTGKKAAGDDYDEQRWFIVVWAEYSGIDAFPDRISNLEVSCAELKLELQLLQKKLFEEKRKTQEADDKLSRHQDRLQHLHDDIQILNHEYYDLSQVLAVVDLILKKQ